MNSDKRMSELYLERDAGKKHVYYVKSSEVWVNKHPEAAFRYDTEYKLAPETLDEFIDNHLSCRIYHSTKDAMKVAAKWAWANPEANPESKE